MPDRPGPHDVREPQADAAHDRGAAVRSHHQHARAVGVLLERDLLLHRHVVAEHHGQQPRVDRVDGVGERVGARRRDQRDGRVRPGRGRPHRRRRGRAAEPGGGGAGRLRERRVDLGQGVPRGRRRRPRPRRRAARWGRCPARRSPCPAASSRLRSVAIATRAAATPSRAPTRRLTCMSVTESTYAPRRTCTLLMRPPPARPRPAPGRRPPRARRRRSARRRAAGSAPGRDPADSTYAASSGMAQPSSAWCSSPHDTAVVRRACSASRVAERQRREAGMPHRAARDQGAGQHVVAGRCQTGPAADQGGRVEVAAEARAGRGGVRTGRLPPAAHPPGLVAGVQGARPDPQRRGRQDGGDQHVRQPHGRRQAHAEHGHVGSPGLVVHAQPGPGDLDRGAALVEQGGQQDSRRQRRAWPDPRPCPRTRPRPARGTRAGLGQCHGSGTPTSGSPSP